jgi:DNA-binding CsgD family transcriptional regulator
MHVALPRPGHQPWTTAEDKLLGTMTDRDLAQRLGRPQQVIRERRRQLAIATFYPAGRRPWTQAEEELLGTMSDQQLARRLKRTPESVKTRRAAKGIPICDPKKHRWTADDDKLLGLRPDAQVAMLLRISVESVKHRRHQLRISLPGQERTISAPKPWRAEDDALLGTVSDQEIAQRLGRSATSVKARRTRLGIASNRHWWTPGQDVLLGKFPDEELARRLGRSLEAVRARRERLGIPVPRSE